MEKHIILCTLTFLISLSLLGQTTESTVRELLDLKSYALDKEAGAVVIYDYGENDFFQNDYGFYTKFTRKLRVKFFSDKNLDLSEFSIPIYLGDESIEEIESFNGKVYNLNDGIIETITTNKKNMHEEKYSKTMYNYKVAVAGVKAGAVMDVEYTLVSPFLFRLQNWQFQHEIPVLHSQYSTHMIPFYTYSYIIKGTNKLDEFTTTEELGMNNFRGTQYGKVLYKFVKKNVPAFIADDYITSENDYLMSLNFQLSEWIHTNGFKERIISTWPLLAKGLINDDFEFGGYLKSSKKYAKKIIEANPAPNPVTLAYLEQLVVFLKANYDWNGNRGYYSDLTPSDFDKSKKGNAAAINLFLVALLREAGFMAEPVILSTRDHGKIYKQYPFLHYFNYTIATVEINGKNYLIDATEKNTNFDQLPTRCLNETGLMVNKGEEKWVSLVSNILSTEINNFFFQLEPNTDSIKCQYTCKETGYYALASKNSYTNDAKKFVEQSISPMFEELTSSKVTSADTSRVFAFSATGKLMPAKAGRFISFKPFLTTTETVNPFKAKERTYPVDFTFARKRSFSAQIMLPENAKLVKQPEKYAADNDLFSLKYSSEIIGNNVVVNAEYSIKKPVYDPSYYAGLKNFYDNLIKYLNQNIEIEL